MSGFQKNDSNEGLPRLALLMTGNEVINGDVIDSNAVYIAKELADIGLSVSSKSTLPDKLEALVKEIRRLSEEVEILIVNGGLGNTIDDLSAEAASLASGRKLQLNPEATRHVIRSMGLAEDSDPARLGKQVLLPEGVAGIPNPEGTALGFSFELNGCICYFTPGVPDEMKSMIRIGILPDLAKRFGLKRPVALNRLRVLGIGEYRLENWIRTSVDLTQYQGVQLGFRAYSPIVEVKLGIENPDKQPLLDEVTEKIQSLFPDYVFSDCESLPAQVNELLRQRKKTLTLAESCTGGLITSYVAAVPGASDILGSAYVTYSYASKSKILGVNKEGLEAKGAVSEEVIVEMVQGALESAEADFALAVSGIAGPGGGTPDKPVGTVYIGWGKPGEIHHRRLWVQRERSAFQHIVALAALDLLRRFILGLPTDAPYYFDALSRQRLPQF